jgi:Protein of unknown function (DUF4236)
MGLSFKVAPGVRIRASSRGLSAGVGPRAARVHVGTRGVGVSSGIGPLSGYTHLGGDGRSAGSQRTGYRPTKAAIAAHERELRAAQREADIEKVAALEASLVNIHDQSFPKARRVELPPPEEIDPELIRSRVEEEAGVSRLIAALGDGDQPPVAPSPEPVDRYSLMRARRKREWRGIPFYRLGDRVGAARVADEAAENEAKAEEERRQADQRKEQERLDGVWGELQAARAAAAERLPVEVEAEKQRRAAKRSSEQKELDAEWERLEANDPMTTIAVLETAFAGNHSPAAPLDCEGDRTTVAMQFPQPDEVVPERKPAITPGGKRTLKKRTKTEANALYLEALGSNVLATVKEAFAVAPGTDVVQMLVIRRETDKKHAGEFAAIYAGEFRRDEYANVGKSVQPGAAIVSAPEALLNLKGVTDQISPLALSDRADLRDVLEQVGNGLSDH